jgi:hypothetical protein
MTLQVEDGQEYQIGVAAFDGFRQRVFVIPRAVAAEVETHFEKAAKLETRKSSLDRCKG